MKRFTMLLCALFLFSGITSVANATLVTIGKAEYLGSDYNSIWDNDDDLVWLDYTKSYSNWNAQVAWALGLNGDDVLDIDLFAGYAVDWGSNSWRLPTTVDGTRVCGYEGDPNNDGVYTYTYGYNLANSEMGHLFYDELGNTGYRNIDGSYNTVPGAPDYFLQNTGDFDNLVASWCWSGTEYADYTGNAWYFDVDYGYQDFSNEYSSGYGLAVRSGQVSASSVPEPGTVFLLGLGLLGFSGLSRRKGRRV